MAGVAVVLVQAGAGLDIHPAPATTVSTRHLVWPPPTTLTLGRELTNNRQIPTSNLFQDKHDIHFED